MKLYRCNKEKEIVEMHKGAIYFDISEDGMCQCKSTGWKLIKDGSECT